MTQVQPLQSLVRKSGNQPILFPTLEIQPLIDTPLKNHYDVLIFISTNAVEYGLAVLKSYHHPSIQIFAVGAVTAKKLNDYGFKPVIFPAENASSEALLAMEKVKVLSNQSILIFRGKGGRETLKQGLGKNNSVEYIEVYQRIESQITQNHHTALTQFLQNKQGIISITSVENLTSMMAMFKKMSIQTDIINAYPLAVLSERIAIIAQSLGFKHIQIAPQANNQGLMQAIQAIGQNISYNHKSKPKVKTRKKESEYG
ncbi:Uroporphyrinogen-III synthase [uncultured Candidatus Thioglobus sp.]|nr:Uroporphyrinogen-III synthase [uncultured Candidatus Thioglobus sp.]